MIRFSLRCERDHGFESWFASNAAFDSLAKAGQLSCPVCGSARVEKALMAPAVAASDAPEAAPLDRMAGMLAAWRKQVEENSDYVGVEFAREARAIHEGLAPERPIWGEARPAEAKALIEDGIPVAPLPFLPRSKTN